MILNIFLLVRSLPWHKAGDEWRLRVAAAREAVDVAEVVGRTSLEARFRAETPLQRYASCLLRVDAMTMVEIKRMTPSGHAL